MDVLSYYLDRAKEMSINKKLGLPAATRWKTQYQTCHDLLDTKFVVQSSLEAGAAEILKRSKGREAAEQFKGTLETPHSGDGSGVLKLYSSFQWMSSVYESDISMVYHYFMALFVHFSDKNKEMKKNFGE